MRRVGSIVLGVALMATAAGACGTAPDSFSSGAPTAAPVPPATPLRSIVQLGDSIASGEGILYGYKWDEAAQDWTGGNLNARWPVPYPDCHNAPAAYGNLVGSYFNVNFAQYACTGSSFANGITAPRTDGSTEYRPAQFGDWANQTNLNPNYDEQQADVVLITLGADDLRFSAVVEACVKNAYEYYFDYADLECTEDNPGSTIEADFFDVLPTLRQNYVTLAGWIEARAVANNVTVPKVIITNYPNPLPADGAICNDTSYFYAQQVEYLSSLVDELNESIEDTVKGMDPAKVRLADISEAYEVQETSHTWCSDDPWAYGLSIYRFSSPSSFESNAPFHPTADGQESIAEHIIPVVRSFYPEQGDAGAPTTAG